MAGHSKWANIKHRKEAQDSKRGKIFSRLNKEISVAVKTGGADPDCNPRLRLAVANARSQNMPKDNIERAIKKASGEGGGNYREITYEGHGPGGVAVFVEAATDNSTRTVASIRHHFSKNGGSLGKDGSLQYIFERKGIFTLDAGECGEEEDFTEAMIEAGIEDIEWEENRFILFTPLEAFGPVQDKLRELGITPLEAGSMRLPLVEKRIDKASEAGLQKLIDALEEDEDVQRVYHNGIS